MTSTTIPNSRNALMLYGLWLLLSVALFWSPCLQLIRYSRGNDNASHILLIPVIVAWLLFTERRKVFEIASRDGWPSLGLLSFAVLLAAWTLRNSGSWSAADQLTSYIFSLVLFCVSGFLFCFGTEAAKRARFTLLFLFLLVPLPDFFLNRVIYVLQKGSADIAEAIFDLTGVPALREGFVFHLAHLNIEVAKECSGIRSSLALFILALIVAHLLLRTFWKQALFVVAGMAIMVVKNGVRIATLTILAQYVDPGFLYGRLHHDGGVVFFLFGLALLFPLLWFLEKSEKRALAAPKFSAS